MNKYYWIISLLMLVFSTSVLGAEIEMADQMRSEGKIYVVVGVMCIIFAGIVAFLIHLERKVGQLEKKIEK